MFIIGLKRAVPFFFHKCAALFSESVPWSLPPTGILYNQRVVVKGCTCLLDREAATPTPILPHKLSNPTEAMPSFFPEICSTGGLSLNSIRWDMRGSLSLYHREDVSLSRQGPSVFTPDCTVSGFRTWTCLYHNAMVPEWRLYHKGYIIYIPNT